MSTLRKGLTYDPKYDGVIKVELNVGYICLLSFLLLLLFCIISLETMCSTQSNCPNLVSVKILHNFVELC